jgi:hypothetical protein
VVASTHGEQVLERTDTESRLSKMIEQIPQIQDIKRGKLTVSGFLQRTLSGTESNQPHDTENTAATRKQTGLGSQPPFGNDPERKEGALPEERLDCGEKSRFIAKAVIMCPQAQDP